MGAPGAAGLDPRAPAPAQVVWDGPAASCWVVVRPEERAAPSGAGQRKWKWVGSLGTFKVGRLTLYIIYIIINIYIYMYIYIMFYIILLYIYIYLDLPGMFFFSCLLLKGRNFCLIFSESPFVFRIACREIMKPKLPQPNCSARHVLIYPNYLNIVSII
jgi:hypothetical protein